jgi:hypothetical protein
MTGDVLLSWFTTLAIGLVVLLVLGVAAVLLARLLGLVTARFHCPWQHRNVMVQYLTCDGRHPSRVVSCSAFADPRQVSCGMPCVSAEGEDSPLATGERAGVLHE